MDGASIKARYRASSPCVSAESCPTGRDERSRWRRHSRRARVHA